MSIGYKTHFNDYPLLDCLEKAQEVIDVGGTVHQKWTCKHCNTRQTMEKQNTFFTQGKCEECKKVTDIDKCNYLAIFGKGARP